eukprot:g9107.t1
MEARRRSLEFRGTYRERTHETGDTLAVLSDWLDTSPLPACPSLRSQNREALRRIACQWSALTIPARRIVENSRTPWKDVRKSRLKFREADLAAQRAAGLRRTESPTLAADSLHAGEICRRPSCSCATY